MDPRSNPTLLFSGRRWARLLPSCLRYRVFACQMTIWSLLFTQVVPTNATEPLRLDSTTSHSNIVDVELSQEGTLSGQVVSTSGVPMSGVQVEVQLIRTAGTCCAVTNERGEFSLPNFSTGVVSVRCQGGGRNVRLWSHGAAPPCASPTLQVCGEPDVVRGQQPLCNLFCSEPVLVGVLVAAAIAIPLALHRSGDDASASN